MLTCDDDLRGGGRGQRDRLTLTYRKQTLSIYRGRAVVIDIWLQLVRY